MTTHTQGEILNSVLKTLNEALAADQHATTMLMEYAIPASIEMMEHPTIQVRGDKEKGFEVRPLGLLNGIVEPLTGKRIAAVYEEGEGFEWRIARFEEWTGQDMPESK